MDNLQQAYDAALAYLLTFVDFSLTHQQQIAPERFELARMVRFLQAFGDPHEKYPSIHIAGTKGKGSVAAHCAAALQAAGYRTGLYTSPHLHDFRERIQINGEMIPQDDFIAIVETFKPRVGDFPGLTAYELQTALAFIYFARQQVDCAVVEVGMGGRLDSTNVVTPLVSVITSISYDHTFVLGDTLAEIAAEKGGIIKSGIPAVSAPQQVEALNVLRMIAQERGAAFKLVGADMGFRAGDHSLKGQKFQVWDRAGGDHLNLETRLLGEHQVENAAVAYAALDQARQRGLGMPDEAIQAGFKQVRWPGRFEVFTGQVAGTQPPLVFDGAHNRYSAAALMRAVADYFPGKPITLVFGASEDKDIAGMFAELLPKTERLILVSAAHPRAAKPADLAELTEGYACPVMFSEQPEQTLPAALDLAAPHGLVLVTGSLYVVGQLRGLWLLKMEEGGYNMPI